MSSIWKCRPESGDQQATLIKCLFPVERGYERRDMKYVFKEWGGRRWLSFSLVGENDSADQVAAQPSRLETHFKDDSGESMRQILFHVFF